MLLEQQSREMDTDYYGLRVEDKTTNGIRIGALGGEFSSLLHRLEVPSEVSRFNGQFLGLYLRWPVKLNQFVSIHSQIEYRYQTAEDNETESRKLTLNSSRAEAGLRLNVGYLAVMPFVELLSEQGDISQPGDNIFIENDVRSGYGLAVDVLFDATSYIRFVAIDQPQQRYSVSFVRDFN